MKERIRQRARELGFDDCRFTTAEPPDHAAEFQQWLAQEQHGEMTWLQRNASKRVNPQHVLPAAKSVIVLAVSYVQSPLAAATRAAPEASARRERFGEAGKSKVQTPADSELTHHASRTADSSGVIARYAQFADYHDVIAERLRTLADLVNALGGNATRSLWYVDTGPILERDLAQRAGLGFVGKHTNLISRTLGNWIFLSEIITTMELEPDGAEHNHCGKCVRCITACPTNAITTPFNVDARRCISYLTIELKGSIPVEFRPLIGNRIYGCDDCLAVCPWNRFARTGAMMRPHARHDLNAPDLIELLSLDDAGFKRRFAGTPVLRTKRRGLLRNVCVALGNVGDTSALPNLERAMADHEPLIQEHAAWAAGQIRGRLMR